MWPESLTPWPLHLPMFFTVRCHAHLFTAILLGFRLLYMSCLNAGNVGLGEPCFCASDTLDPAVTTVVPEPLLVVANPHQKTQKCCQAVGRSMGRVICITFTLLCDNQSSWLPGTAFTIPCHAVTSAPCSTSCLPSVNALCLPVPPSPCCAHLEGHITPVLQMLQGVACHGWHVLHSSEQEWVQAHGVHAHKCWVRRISHTPAYSLTGCRYRAIQSRSGG